MSHTLARRIVTLALAVAMAAASLSACQSKDRPRAGAAPPTESGKPAGAVRQSSPYAGRVAQQTRRSFEEVVGQLDDAIKVRGLMVVFTADHQKMLAMVGMRIRPSRTLLVFHPSLGQRLFRADPAASIEAPLRLAVSQTEDGKTQVSYDKPSSILGKYGHPELKQLGAELDRTFADIVKEATR